MEKEGKAKVEYISGDTYDGDFNQEKMKHGQGTYVWTKKNEDEEIVPKATYTGSYVDGKRCGVGTMTFPNGDVYQGEWKDNKARGRENQHTHAHARCHCAHSPLIDIYGFR